MIKIENDTLEMKGTGIQLMTEYSALTHSLKKYLMDKIGLSEEDANEKMKYLFEIGLKDDKEIEDEAKKLIERDIAKGILFAMLSAVFKE